MVGHASFFCLWKCDYQHGLTYSGLHNLDITCSCCGFLLLNWRHLLQIFPILAVRILTSEKCVIDNRDDLKNKSSHQGTQKIFTLWVYIQIYTKWIHVLNAFNCYGNIF